MPIPPAAIVGGQALAGLFQGLAGSGGQKAATKEQARQFNIQGAFAPTRALEALPLRDRLLHILLSRFGNNPTTYTGAQAAYTPGAGGTAQSGEIYREMLRRMGYGDSPESGNLAYNAARKRMALMTGGKAGY